MRERLPRTEEELQEISPRWKLISWFIVGAITLLAGKLWYLQILHGATLRKYSERNRLKEVTIPAERGWILDRHQDTLVDNLQGLELTITPQYITDLPLMAERIAPIIHKTKEYIIEKIQIGEKQYGPFRPVLIKKHLTVQQVTSLKLLQWDFTGMDIQETIIRHYPLKDNGAHLFGYMGEISKNQMDTLNKKYKNRFYFQIGDWVGKSGLESVWEHELRGKDGFSFVEVDAHNRQSSTNIGGLWNFKPQDPLRGNHLVLTIDKKLQEVAYNSLFRKDKIGTRHGSIVVMKTNGEILAWCSYPSYNPNIFSVGLSTAHWMKLANNPFQPMRDKIIQNHYAPGSIFKPIVALAALQEELITPDTLIHSPREIVFGRRVYHDYRKTGHGYINLNSAIERSANVFFYKLGIKLGIDTISHYARLLNLGKKTNIRLKGEVAGFIPDSQWKIKHLGESWQPGENLSHAIGQGFILVTPVQMAVAYNAIATGGKIVRPFIVKKIINSVNQEIKTIPPQVIKHVGTKIQESHFQVIKQALKQVVHGTSGTARWWKTKEVPMAGKTGTAQVISFSKDSIHKNCYKRPLEQRHHGWFVAFAPVDKPEIVISVLTEHSCSGSSGSAPIARDIIRFYFKNKKKEQYSKNALSNST